MAYVYMDGVFFYIFFFTCLRSIQVILQLFCSALTSDVCCLKILLLLLGEKDMFYVCNKVSFFFFIWGGGGGGKGMFYVFLGFKATIFFVNSIFFLDLQKVQEITKNTIK